MMTKKDEWIYWTSLLVLIFTGFVIIRGLFDLFSEEGTAGLTDTLIGLLVFTVIFWLAGRTFLNLSNKYGADADKAGQGTGGSAGESVEESAGSPIQKLNPFSTAQADKNEDWRFLDYSGSAAMAERLESAFENDPRAFNVSCNTGFHYTTGESSGSYEENVREGQPEVGVFSMKYKAGDEAEIMAIYNRITSKT